jgi:hypothetical protein
VREGSPQLDEISRQVGQQYGWWVIARGAAVIENCLFPIVEAGVTGGAVADDVVQALTYQFEMLSACKTIRTGWEQDLTTCGRVIQAGQ